jgi:hypothetical protein
MVFSINPTAQFSSIAPYAGTVLEQLTQALAGVDPGTRQKMWLALQHEPQRLARTGVDQALLTFVRAGGRPGWMRSVKKS